MKMHEEMKRSERVGDLLWQAKSVRGRNGMFKMKGKYDFAQQRKEMEG